MISWRRVAVGFLGLFLLSLLSVLSVVLMPGSTGVQAGVPAAAPGPEERARLMAEIERRRAIEGRQPPPAHGTMNPLPPSVSRVPMTITTSKAEMLKQWDEGWARDQAYYSVLEKNGFKASADAKRTEALEARKRIEALPDGPIERTRMAVKVGDDTTRFWPQTLDRPGTVDKDP